MEFIELNDSQIKLVYETYMVNDFPSCELKPLSIIMNAKSNKTYRCFALVEEGEFTIDKVMAYTYFASDKAWETVLLDYFAVNGKLRGTGIGSKMLNLVKEYFGNNTEISNVIIESESIESARNDDEVLVRTKRIRFYEKNGLLKLSKKPVVFGTEYTMFVMNISNSEKMVSEAEILESYLNVYKSMLTKKMYDENIFLEIYE